MSYTNCDGSNGALGDFKNILDENDVAYNF